MLSIVKMSKFTWWALSSCTRDMKALEAPAFLGKIGKRTLFSVPSGHGELNHAVLKFQR